MNDLIYLTEEDRIAVQYFSRLTNTVGAVGFGVAFTLFSLPPFYAWLCFSVFFIWAFLQGYQYRKMLKQTNECSRPGVWVFIKYGWLCLLSLTFMAAVALRAVTEDAFFGIVL